MAVRVNFEIGHEASIRTKKTPEGFTHDWEVFVRGQEGADISHFVDKVVFHLHETFPKPKRVVKEPPFTVKESGYAGFTLPIEIYLRNKDEPKKIKFTYELNLQQSGPATLNFMKDRYIFHNPNEDFKKKLIKGGGFIISNHTMYANPDQDTKSRDSFTDEKPQLVSKPKLSGESSKKHRVKDEPPLRFNSFENLFGTPLQKPSKVSPELKPKPAPIIKTEKKEKEKHSTDKDKQKPKHEHKEKTEKIKIKDEKEKIKEDKTNKNLSKDAVDRQKEKLNRKLTERPISPNISKKLAPSPVKRPPSPQPRSSSASSIKEDLKPKIDQEPKKLKVEEKPSEIKTEKEKKKKDKKDKDKDKSRKDHKKEGHKPTREIPKDIIKSKELSKEKEVLKEVHMKEKLTKPDKPFNKFSIENLVKTPQDLVEESKVKESERKHKHKKKDKKRDESKEKHRDSSERKEKKHKHEKSRELLPETKDLYLESKENREALISKDRPVLEPGSPISLDTASQCSSKSGIGKGPIIVDDGHTSHSDSETSVLIDDDVEMKVKQEIPLPEPVKELPPSPDPEPVSENLPGPSQKDKSKKHKDKSTKRDNDEKKRRKRKANDNDESDSRKLPKIENVTVKPEGERIEGENSVGTSETKVQDNGVSSSLGEDAEPGDLSPDYMVQLRELQQRIMTIKSNEELERVVNLIAETGRYEVTTQTFDFDLCLLDRSTVQRLIQLVG